MAAGPVGRSPRRLVLHFDVNSTIIAADPASGADVEGLVSRYLAGASWGREVDGVWRWSESSLAGDLSLTCAPDAECSYYKYLERKMSNEPRAEFKRVLDSFCSTDEGVSVKPWLDRLVGALRAAGEGVGAPFNFEQGGTTYCFVLPSFWNLLSWLRDEGRDFSVVLRTFGTDGPDVMEALRLYAEGKHPRHPQGCPPALPSRVAPSARLRRSGAEGFRLELAQEDGETRILQGEDKVFAFFESLRGSALVVDDYDAWAAGKYCGSAGKPLWIPVDRCSDMSHHIFFDDNFRVAEPENSIVDARILAPGSALHEGSSVDAQAAFDLGCVVQAELHRAILEHDYFIREVQRCSERAAKAFDAA